MNGAWVVTTESSNQNAAPKCAAAATTPYCLIMTLFLHLSHSGLLLGHVQ